MTVISQLLGFGVFLGLLSACTASPPIRLGSLNDKRLAASERRLLVIPATLKIRPDQIPETALTTKVELHAACGETESTQLLFFAGPESLEIVNFQAEGLVSESGAAIQAELKLVGYVQVDRPSFVGFRQRGLYPDPLLPDQNFSLAAQRTQALFYSVRVPSDAAAGWYHGEIKLTETSGQVWSLPVALRVYDVVLPKTSFLKTSVNFRRESFRDQRYYGEAWTDQRDAELDFIGLDYRFSSRVDLPLEAVFYRQSDGSLQADWSEFDQTVAAWRAQGISAFELKLGITWAMTPELIAEVFGDKLRLIDEHLQETGLSELCYFYFYDEPSYWELGQLRQRLKTIRSFAPSIPNILTYGLTKAGEKQLVDEVGIWVPNIDQFEPAFARERQAAGDQVWIYVCVKNVLFPYPDNYRIDWYGCAHRALGWWLRKYDIDGFLYWAVDLWRRNPWEITETFRLTNGDGMLFYPALDRALAPYPSIRAYLFRDAIEDYDLLTMLSQAYPVIDGQRSATVQALLEARELIPAKNRFSLDDQLYITKHREVLELLEAAGLNHLDGS